MPANIRQCAQPPTARQAIAAFDPCVPVYAASAWDMSTELRLGELPESDDIAADLAAYLRKLRFEAYGHLRGPCAGHWLPAACPARTATLSTAC